MELAAKLRYAEVDYEGILLLLQRSQPSQRWSAQSTVGDVVDTNHPWLCDMVNSDSLR